MGEACHDAELVDRGKKNQKKIIRALTFENVCQGKLVTVQDLSIDSVSLLSLGDLYNVQLFGRGEAGGFSFDAQGVVLGHLQVENTFSVLF